MRKTREKHSSADAMCGIPCKQCCHVETAISVQLVLIQVTEDVDILQKEPSEDTDISIVRIWLDRGKRL